MSEHGGSWYLTVRAVVNSLRAADGDVLCFTPTGRGAAAVQLQKAPAAAVPGTATAAPAAGAGAPAGAPADAAMAAMAAAGEGRELGTDEMELDESAGDLDGQGSGLAEQYATTAGSQEGSPGSDSEDEPPLKRRRPRLRQEGSHAGTVGASPNWSGLEEGEEDAGVYTLTLPPAAFKEGGSLKIHTPGAGRQGICVGGLLHTIVTLSLIVCNRQTILCWLLCAWQTCTLLSPPTAALQLAT